MDMEQLLPKMRDQIKAANKEAKLCLVCDNMILISEEHDVVTWDDGNTCLYVVRRANQQDTNMDCDFMVVPYSNVQYIEVNESPWKIRDIANVFNMDSEAIDKFVKQNTTFKL